MSSMSTPRRLNGCLRWSVDVTALSGQCNRLQTQGQKTCLPSAPTLLAPVQHGSDWQKQPQVPGGADSPMNRYLLVRAEDGERRADGQDEEVGTPYALRPEEIETFLI